MPRWYVGGSRIRKDRDWHDGIKRNARVWAKVCTDQVPDAALVFIVKGVYQVVELIWSVPAMEQTYKLVSDCFSIDRARPVG